MDTRKFNKLIDNPDSGLLILIQQTQKHLEKGISLKLEVLEKSVLNATRQLSLDKVTPTDVNWSKFLKGIQNYYDLYQIRYYQDQGFEGVDLSEILYHHLGSLFIFPDDEIIFKIKDKQFSFNIQQSVINDQKQFFESIIEAIWNEYEVDFKLIRGGHNRQRCLAFLSDHFEQYISKLKIKVVNDYAIIMTVDPKPPEKAYDRLQLDSNFKGQDYLNNHIQYIDDLKVATFDLAHFEFLEGYYLFYKSYFLKSKTKTNSLALKEVRAIEKIIKNQIKIKSKIL